MASMLVEALKGAQAEVLERQSLLARLAHAGKLTRVLAAEVTTALGLAPFGLRAVRCANAVAVAGSAAAEPGRGAPPFGVVLCPALPYGPGPRHQVDVFVPARLYEQTAARRPAASQQQAGGAQAAVQQQFQQQQRQQRQQQQQQQQQAEQQQCQQCQAPQQQQCQQHCQQECPQQCQQQCQQECQQEPCQQECQPLVPVVFFVHGGIWATGERWHFSPLAVRLAQEGLVVVLCSYTLYPQALASQMACEVAAAYAWIGRHVSSFGGDPRRITVIGHSAGGHLGALALLLLAQQRHEALCAQPQAAAAAAAAALPPPAALFVGMSGVYDVARHHAFESARGVAGISTMARACGGGVMFDAVSPAALLRKAAAAAACARAAGRGSSTHGARQQAQQQQQQHVLLGEEIPLRSGMEEAPEAAAAVVEAAAGEAGASDPGAASACSSSISSRLLQGVPIDGDAAALLAGFSQAAARHLPPCIIMSSLGDHMVPWHEGAEMVFSLRGCGVAAKQLIYERALHNDFALAWSPLSAAQRAAVVAAPTAAAGAAPDGAGLPPFAADLLAICLRRVSVRFPGPGASGRTAAALAAMERAAGLAPPGAVAAAAAGSDAAPWRLPQPLSRL